VPRGGGHMADKQIMGGSQVDPAQFSFKPMNPGDYSTGWYHQEDSTINRTGDITSWSLACDTSPSRSVLRTTVNLYC